MRTIVTGGRPWISWPNVSELLRRGRPITVESEFPQPHRHYDTGATAGPGAISPITRFQGRTSHC